MFDLREIEAKIKLKPAKPLLLATVPTNNGKKCGFNIFLLDKDGEINEFVYDGERPVRPEYGSGELLEDRGDSVELHCRCPYRRNWLI